METFVFKMQEDGYKVKIENDYMGWRVTVFPKSVNFDKPVNFDVRLAA
jgi:hypothetical protein